MVDLAVPITRSKIRVSKLVHLDNIVALQKSIVQKDVVNVFFHKAEVIMEYFDSRHLISRIWLRQIENVQCNLLLCISQLITRMLSAKTNPIIYIELRFSPTEARRIVM